MQKPEFNTLVVGRTITNQFRLRKQNSLKPSDHTRNNSTAKLETQTSAALPIPRRLSVKSTSSHPTNLLRKVIRDKILHKKPPAASTLTYEDPPNLPKKSFHNERVYWKKRNLSNLPVLIIVFEGVLGSYTKNSFWTDERPSFTFRDNFLHGLYKLKDEFYLVLLSTYPKAVTKELLSLLDQKQNIFDAVYMQRHRNWHARHVHDVVSILEDFSVEDKSQVLALSAIGIDAEEIANRTGQELISESTASFKKKFLTYFSPTCPKEVPVTVLVPHLLLMNKLQSFLDVAGFVMKFKRINKDFFEGFEEFGGTKLESVFQDFWDKCVGLPIHKFVFSTRESFKQMKPSTSGFNVRKARRIKL